MKPHSDFMKRKVTAEEVKEAIVFFYINNYNMALSYDDIHEQRELERDTMRMANEIGLWASNMEVSISGNQDLSLEDRHTKLEALKKSEEYKKIERMSDNMLILHYSMKRIFKLGRLKNMKLIEANKRILELENKLAALER